MINRRRIEDIRRDLSMMPVPNDEGGRLVGVASELLAMVDYLWALDCLYGELKRFKCHVDEALEKASAVENQINASRGDDG